MARLLRALCALSLTWALLVAFTGGFDVHAFGQRIRSTSPDRPVYATAIVTALYVYSFRDDARRRAQAFARFAPAVVWLERAALPIVILLSLVVFVVGVRQGVLVAEASDAYGYVSQADLWLARDLTIEQPFVRGMPWPDADWTFAPLGYRPTSDGTAIVPTYPPGLPLLMAAGKRIAGACGPFLIVPLLGGLTIWFTYLLGARLSSRLIGVAAAGLLATSPIFLMMTLTPMSDVPATAFLMLGLVLAISPSRWRAFWTGVAMSMAIVIRPNLVVVGAVFAAFLMLRAAPLAGESPWRGRVRALLWFSLGGAPLMLGLAAFNAALHGAPWDTGYVGLGGLYSWRFIWRNLIDYPTWLWASETALIALSVVPLIYRSRLAADRSLLAFLTSVVAAVWLSYLVYRAFGEWQYLRFLLPIIPVLLVLAACGMAMLLARLREPGARLAMSLLVIGAVLALRVGVVRGEGVLGVWREGLPFTSVGEYVGRQLPANAIILTVSQSGSIRYYAHRPTLRWDLLPREWWPRALAVLTERGYRPYVLLASGEESAFRSRFDLPAADDGAGTVVAAFSGPEVHRLYDPLRISAGTPASIPTVRADPCGCL